MSEQTLPVRISRLFSAAADILCIELEHIEGQLLPAFEAGAHVDIHIADFVRQYSICSAPENQQKYRLAIKLEQDGRGGSQAVHQQLKQGDQLKISAPRNNFPLNSTAKHSILVAGGIGITPMLAMAQYLLAQKQSFELHYCCRGEEHAVFYEELKSGRLQENLHFHFDDGEDSQKLDLPSLLSTSDADTHLYVCGPEAFMNFVTSAASEQFAWPEANVHTESFGAVDMAEDGDRAFTVKLASTGKSYNIPADMTVVDALEEQGVEIPLSCEQGVCGTCLTKILEGEPDHRDMFLTDAEQAANDQFTPCCSRSKSAVLVLDM